MPIRDQAATYEHCALLRMGGSRRGWSLSIERIGTITLPDGRLSAGDPSQDLFGTGSPSELMPHVEPGVFAVDVSFAERRGDRRIAAVLLEFSAKEVTSWENVFLADDGSSLRLGHEIAVDSAFAYVGAFSAARSIATSGTSLMEIATRGQRGRTFEWGEVPVGDAGNLYYFSTGMGDGSYPLLIGRDAGTIPVVLILDFLMIGRP